MITGGLAVSIYTTPRATEDIDLLIYGDDLERVVRALHPVGFRAAGRPMQVAGGRMHIQRLTKIDGAHLLPLDLLMPADPSLATLLDDRVNLTVEGQQIALVSLRGLRVLHVMDHIQQIEKIKADPGYPES